MSLSRNRLLAIYYLGVVALTAVGAILWSTGHGTGDPYLTLGIGLALVPPVVECTRRLFRRG